jgi:hypothetical protein
MSWADASVSVSAFWVFNAYHADLSEPSGLLERAAAMASTHNSLSGVLGINILNLMYGQMLSEDPSQFGF